MKRAKTYNSGYSLVVTHLTTNPPIRCLNMAERTGSLVFNVLWLYVLGILDYVVYMLSAFPSRVAPDTALVQYACAEVASRSARYARYFLVGR